MNKIVIGIFVLLAGAVVGWYARGTSEQPVPPVNEVISETPTPSPQATSGAELLVPTAKASVQYTQGGFSPRTITVSAGTAVVFTNASTAGMWVASAVHPTHQLLPGFDQKAAVQTGGTYEYIFADVGSWQYHNHVNPQDTGTVIVTE